MSHSSPPSTAFNSFNVTPSSSQGANGLKAVLPALDEHNIGREVVFDARPAAVRTLSAQKRAYRSRRKDPSCDACRDRKVRCNASEDTSCSECSSRGVKCQFTKDSNRRMSSLKQIQDLQNQLSEARQKVSDLQASSTIPQAETARPALLQTDAYTFAKPCANRAEVARDMTHAGRGLFRRPLEPEPPLRSDCLSALPPQDMAFDFAHRYFETVGAWLPVIDVQKFYGELEAIYRTRTAGSLQGTSIALIYGVLACGARGQHENAALLGAAVDLYRSYSGHDTRGSVLVALLLGVYHLERNAANECLQALALALRSAQQLGLHNSVDDELWHAIRYLDALVSLDLGLPMLSTITDCPDDMLSSATEQKSVNITLLANAFEKTCQATRSKHIDGALLSQLENEFEIIRAAQRMAERSPSLLAERFHVNMLLQSAKLHLHRHNLTPASTRIQRKAALQECTQIASETAELTRSSVRALPPSTMEHYGSSFLYKHLWRCLLFLTAAGQDAGTAQLMSVLKQWQSHPELEAVCSSYTTFFLHKLSAAARDVPLEDDEEMLAYLTADLQQNADVSWIWDGVDECRDATASSVRCQDDWQSVNGSSSKHARTNSISALQDTHISPQSETTSQQPLKLPTNAKPVNRISINDLV